MIDFDADSFWKDYPTDEAKFEALVLDGVYFYPAYPAGIRVQSEYNGVSSGKLRRYYKSWKSDRDKFIRERPLHVIKAMFAFEKDYEKSDVDEVILMTSMPIAPPGYYWAENRGGLCFRVVFRLWNNKFGYIPCSD